MENKICRAEDYDALIKTGFLLQITFGKTLIVSPHSHDFYEVLYIIKGSCTQNINQTDYYCAKGDIIILKPGDTHFFKGQSADTSVICISAAAEEMERFFGLFNIFEKPFGRDKAVRIANLTLSQREIIDSLYLPASFIKDEPLRVEITRLLLLNLLQFFVINNPKLTNIQFENSADDFDKVLLQMTLPENIKGGIDSLMTLSSFSHSHLCRIFKAKYNITPHQYIYNLKMNYALELVISSKDSFEEIAEKTGYQSFSHFNKIFKNHFGKTPSAMRNENKNQSI